MTKEQSKKQTLDATTVSTNDAEEHSNLEKLRAQAEVNMRVYYFIQNHLIKDSNPEVQAESAILAQSVLDKANSIKKTLSGD